jgi:hypothetical protein
VLALCPMPSLLRSARSGPGGDGGARSPTPFPFARDQDQVAWVEESVALALLVELLCPRSPSSSACSLLIRCACFPRLFFLTIGTTKRQADRSSPPGVLLVACG